jgi:lysophospholipase L1-like esterase
MRTMKLHACLLSLLAAPLAYAQDRVEPNPPGAGIMEVPCPDQAGLWFRAPYIVKYDWAWMCKYQKANALLAKDGRPKAILIGDSITEGWVQGDPQLFDKTGIVGRGIGGQTSPQILLRFYQDVVALRPKVVHIMIGTNDIAGNTGPSSPTAFQGNIRAMVDIARANGIKVILGSILPADRFSWQPELKPAPHIKVLNHWLKQFAHDKGLIFADYHATMAGPNGELPIAFGKDGVHPDRNGYAVMKPILEKAIRSALGKK